MKRAMVWSIALMVSLLASSQAQAQQTNQAKRGLSVAKMACVHCHAVQKTSRRSPVAAAPRFVDIANSQGMTATKIIAALETTPHRTMPTWKINTEARNDLVTYILSLKRGQPQ